ncbi:MULTISPECIES: ABC transporter substrate-binding protein [unclassified Streptomyces]|uniref:ABC transporter substrate-binding protein n=1 Tax=unclassified Streptomyces TaxID=2593676 RepID=UPI002E795A33|nr:ABC transporter substrate-binding protein [Streptomyces sp. JV190]MEE1841493.1 ABC transporter substrate-binding protein [Streptomyces sp. JV190]
MPTRRSFLLLSAGALTAAGLTACSTAEPSPGAGGAPRDGGTLTFATDVEPDNFDPHVSPADIVGVLLRNVFDSLVAQRQDGGFEPWLAREWEVSDDGRAYTFRLRDDVEFTDGTPFDAAAVKANFDHIVAPATKSQYAATLIGPYARTDVVDRHTVTVRLKKPYASFLHAVSTTYLGFHSPKALRERPGELAAGGGASVGTGAFTFVSRVKGQRLVFARNASYAWAPASAKNDGPAHLERLVVTFLPENATRVGAVTSGQADVADALPANRIAALKSQPGLSISSHDSPGIVYSYFLNTERAPFDQRDARLAVLHAVDTEAITKAVFAGQYRRAWGPLSPSTPGYAAAVENSWKHDPARAGALLDGLGWTGRDADGYRTKDGRRFRLTLLYVPAYTKSERRTFDTAVQDDLRKAGIELVLKPLDAGSYTPVRDRGDYDVIAFAWGGSDPDLLRTVFHSGSQLADGGANGSRLHDPRIDGWLDAATATTGRKEREALYAKVQERIVAQGYALPAFVGTRQLGVRGRAHDVAFDASAWPLFQGAWVGGS